MRVDPPYNSLIGLYSERGVNQFRADKFINGIEAIPWQPGLISRQLPDANTDRALVNASTQEIVVTDPIKFDKVVPVIISRRERAVGFVESLHSRRVQVALS